MHILTIDIETSPNLAYVWGLWQQNVSISQLHESTEMLCFAAKWHNERRVQFYSKRDSQDEMLKAAYGLLDEADVVISYNGKKFDVPHLQREIATAGWPPPSPFKQVDLYRVVKEKFNFPSNKLECVARELGVGRKGDSGGFETWLGCMSADQTASQKAWRKMERYNKQDVIITEALYGKLLPWIDGHPNYQLYGDISSCPRCGNDNLTKQGYAYTALGQFQRYRCGSCGGWSRSSKRVAGVNQQAAL